MSPNVNTAAYDIYVMQKLAQGANAIGLTPESLYRAADSACAGEIKPQEFKMFLQKAKLGLKSSNIGRIISLCDDDSTGAIKRENYYNLLEAYDLTRECQPTEEGQSFQQRALHKLAELLIDNTIGPEEMYEEMKASSATGCPGLFQLNNFIFKYGKLTFSDRECIAIYNYFDLQKNGVFVSEFFFREMRKLIIKLSKEKGIDAYQFIQMSQSKLTASFQNNQQESSAQKTSQFGTPGEYNIHKKKDTFGQIDESDFQKAQQLINKAG